MKKSIRKQSTRKKQKKRSIGGNKPIKKSGLSHIKQLIDKNKNHFRYLVQKIEELCNKEISKEGTKNVFELLNEIKTFTKKYLSDKKLVITTDKMHTKSKTHKQRTHTPVQGGDNDNEYLETFVDRRPNRFFDNYNIIVNIILSLSLLIIFNKMNEYTNEIVGIIHTNVESRIGTRNDTLIDEHFTNRMSEILTMLTHSNRPEFGNFTKIINGTTYIDFNNMIVASNAKQEYDFFSYILHAISNDAVMTETFKLYFVNNLNKAMYYVELYIYYYLFRKVPIFVEDTMTFSADVLVRTIRYLKYILQYITGLNITGVPIQRTVTEEILANNPNATISLEFPAAARAARAAATNLPEETTNHIDAQLDDLLIPQ